MVYRCSDYGRLRLCSKYKSMADSEAREVDYGPGDSGFAGRLQDGDGCPDNHRCSCKRQDKESGPFRFYPAATITAAGDS